MYKKKRGNPAKIFKNKNRKVKEEIEGLVGGSSKKFKEMNIFG